MINMQIQLINAYEMSVQNPEKFEFPSNDELAKIKIGDGVKICNGKERFWTQVTNIQINNQNILDSTIIAIVDNNLIDSSEYDYGTVLSFNFKNIYDIYFKDNKTEFLRAVLEKVKKLK